MSGVTQPTEREGGGAREVVGVGGGRSERGGPGVRDVVGGEGVAV